MGGVCGLSWQVWEYQDRERDVYTWHLFDG